MSDDEDELKLLREQRKTSARGASAGSFGVTGGPARPASTASSREDETTRRSDEAPVRPRLGTTDGAMPSNMSPDDIMAMMGFGGFGKATKANPQQSSRKMDPSARLAERTATETNVEAPSKKADSETTDNDHVTKRTEEEGDDEEDDEEEEEDEDEDEEGGGGGEEEYNEEERAAAARHVLPVSHSVTMKHGAHAVSALALDPAGARLATGDTHFEVKLWNFAGMDSSMRAFRTFEIEGHALRELDYNLSGDMFLCITGNSRPRVYNRDGAKILECVKGDPYLNDMTHTKGHISMTNSGCWDPTDKSRFYSCSTDSTVRVWDASKAASGALSKQDQVIRVKSRKGHKVNCTAMACSPDGKLIAVASNDGSIQMFKGGGARVFKPTIHIHDAHAAQSETSSIAFSPQGGPQGSYPVVTRGGDETVKLWDVRAAARPVHVWTGIESLFVDADCSFAPDGRAVVFGPSVRKTLAKGQTTMESGSVDVYDAVSSFERLSSVSLAPGVSCVRTRWHSRLNQIVVGLSDGDVQVLYDPRVSNKGALLCAGRAISRRQRAFNDGVVSGNGPIITPHALPLFRGEKHKSRKRQREKESAEARKAFRPDLPLNGPGKGGRISGMSTLTQHIARNISYDATKDEDPREAILKKAAAAAANPEFTAMYSKTQPVAVLAKTVDSDDET